MKRNKYFLFGSTLITIALAGVGFSTWNVIKNANESAKIEQSTYTVTLMKNEPGTDTDTYTTYATYENLEISTYIDLPFFDDTNDYLFKGWSPNGTSEALRYGSVQVNDFTTYISNHSLTLKTYFAPKSPKSTQVLLNIKYSLDGGSASSDTYKKLVDLNTSGETRYFLFNLNAEDYFNIDMNTYEISNITSSTSLTYYEEMDFSATKSGTSFNVNDALVFTSSATIDLVVNYVTIN